MLRGGRAMMSDSAGSYDRLMAGHCSVMRSIVRMSRPGSASGSPKARVRKMGKTSGTACASE